MGITDFVAARDLLLRAGVDRSDSGTACDSIFRAVQRVTRVDAAAVMRTDPDTNLPAGGVVFGFSPDQCAPFWDNELLDPDFNKFNALSRSIEPIATLVDATDGELHRSPRYKKLYAAFGATDELRLAFMSGTSCLAIGTFVRLDGEYEPSEVADVRNLIAPAVAALRASMCIEPDASAPVGLAVLLVDSNGRLRSGSLGSDRILDDLRVEVDGELPGVLGIAATRHRSGTSDILTTRLRGASGRWYRATITPMRPTSGDDAEVVSVTIDEARASDTIPILLDSYGLTDREIRTALALARGLGTKEIGVELGISTHTVRDHLKSIFAKSKVNSRGELVARLFCSHWERHEGFVTHVASANGS